MINWKDVGDGSVFDPMPAAGQRVSDVWPNPGRSAPRTGARSSTR